MPHAGPGASRAPHHPWRRFAELSDWSLQWADLPAGVMGFTCHRTRTVTVALGMSQAERRCTIAHETEHIVRGPVPPHEATREELTIDRRVATLLIPSLRHVADAMVRACGRVDAAADELWVDDYLLQVRLAWLSDRECAYVDRRLAEVGRSW
jgi:hypothetical protein